MAAIQTAFNFAAPRRAARALDESPPASVAAPGSPPAVTDGTREVEAPPGGRRSAGALEAMLRGALRRQVHVTFTDNARTMLSLRHREEAAFVRLHHMFSDAPAPILASIARYLQDGEQAAASRLSRYIDSRRERIRARPTRTPTLKTRGEQHDLCAIFAQLNRVYFADAIEARIGWGRMGRAPGRRRRRRSIKLGSYRERDALIRIHPALDQAWVPRFFVEYVVYHEMLHHALGIGVRAGRRRMHTPEFRRRERAFAWHAEATLWEREHLSRLLSS